MTNIWNMVVCAWECQIISVSSFQVYSYFTSKSIRITSYVLLVLLTERDFHVYIATILADDSVYQDVMLKTHLGDILIEYCFLLNTAITAIFL